MFVKESLSEYQTFNEANKQCRLLDSSLFTPDDKQSFKTLHHIINITTNLQTGKLVVIATKTQRFRLDAYYWLGIIDNSSSFAEPTKRNWIAYQTHKQLKPFLQNSQQFASFKLKNFGNFMKPENKLNDL